MTDRNVGEKSKRSILSPNSLREKRLRALGQLLPITYDECAICTEPIISDGFKHCAHSHNHKTCMRQWIHHAVQTRNQRANQCGTCFEPLTETQLQEIGVHEHDIRQLYPPVRRLSEAERIKQIIDEIMNNDFTHIGNIEVRNRNIFREIMDYFNDKNIERLGRININANLIINVDLTSNYEANGVDINQPLYTYMREMHRDKIEKIICNELEYRGSHNKMQSPLQIIKDIGHRLMYSYLIDRRHMNALLSYLQQNTFVIKIYVDTNEYDIDGYMRSSKPCRGSGCSIMGGKKGRGTKKSRRKNTKKYRR